MITVDSTPPLVALTGNPIRFGLSSDNHLEQAGSKIVNTIQFAAKGAANDWFLLVWGSHMVTFTCKPAPDDSGYQIPDESVVTDLDDWVVAVAATVAANYLVDHDFVVTVDNLIITLTARQYGQELAIDPSQNWTPMQQIIFGVSGSERIYRDFFKIGLQLLLKVDGTFTNIGEDVLPVSDTGEALFDIHNLFADRLYPEFKFPEASNQIVTLRTHQSGEYRIRYFEQYGNPVLARKLTESTSFYALLGGISTLQQAIYNRLGSNFWAKLGYNQYFLTWAPTTKTIDRWTTEKLFYLVRSAIASLVLKIEINYNDQTAQSTITKDTVATPTLYGVYEIACSLNVLQLAGYDSGIIDTYRVWIEDGASNRISEIRTFRMDYGPNQEVRQYLFLNSLGSWDTLRTTGEVSDDLQYSRISISKVLGVDFTEVDHEVATGSTSELRVHKANIGWKTREDVAWIRDFFLSKQVYEMRVGKLVPIVITTTQAHQATTREDLYSIDFEYHRSYRSEFYSKEIVGADFTDDFNDDFTNE